MKKRFQTVSVIGLGYVGLPTAATLANRGFNVIGVDVDERAVNTINSGHIHIVEPDLDIAVQASVTTGKLRATTQPEPADAFMIAVPTPFKEDHKPDLKYIEAATRAFAPHLRPGNLVVLESTSPVGTTELIAQWISEIRPELRLAGPGVSNPDIYLAHCPERILPGHVLRELVENDRIIGGLCPESAQAAAELYGDFVAGQCLLTDSRTAELSKLVENSYRDVNIAFANELSLICDELSIDVWKVIEMANYHPRVNILQPGAGVGGHCIAVDPWFIVDSAPETARLIRTAREVNDFKPRHIVAKVNAAADKFKNPTIACLGLAYKPDIDDLRESPAMAIVRDLAQSESAKILAVEPNIEEIPASLGKLGVELAPLDQALSTADIIVILVPHKPFLQISRSDFEMKMLINVTAIKL